jgi:hypothetical protein
MNKWVLALILVLFWAQAAFGETVFERSFGEMGYADFVVEGPNKENCTLMEFVFPGDLNIFKQELYPILSLHITFLPVQEGNAAVITVLNDTNISESSVEDFVCGESSCWERISMPKELLRGEEKNKLKICLRSGNTIVKEILHNDSMIGIYKTAFFGGESDFRMFADKSEILIGEKIKITAHLHNSGSGSAFVKVDYTNKIGEEKQSFREALRIIEGQTYFEGVLDPGEDAVIEYIMRPRVLGPMIMPPAVASFENVFGELETISSNFLTLQINEPEIKIDAFILKESEINRTGEQTELTLAVKNLGRDRLYNIAVFLDLPEGLRLVREPRGLIEDIGAGETKYLDFAVVASEAEEFSIGCRIVYLDLDITESYCRKTPVVFEAVAVHPTAIIGMVLVAIAVIIYLYLRFGK